MYKLFQLQLLQKVVATAHQLLSYSAPSHNYSSHSSSVRLSNGNTAGSVGSYAAAQMAARTGVSASTWEHIIARESNGQLHARNASGAAGLFQTMPGWGSTGSVNDQINAAYKAYKSTRFICLGYVIQI